ncbi:MAG: chromosome partitioning protein ParB [Candidatus Tectimicrobiota bacterium]|nr:MAG: chromosome partitioning protein ParB [Candidatus Tectomicrobia bacterium]
MRRQALGKGLAALFGPVPPDSHAELVPLPVAQIRPNPYQPRQHLDPQRLQELAQSIKAQGLLQPIVVRRHPEGFELIAGERRLRAAQLAGYDTVPALIRDADDREVLLLALLENLQRDDLNPLEEARAYQRLVAEFGLRQEDIARQVGKDRSSVANALRLLKLPPLLQEDLAAGRLSMGHARALLALESAEAQQRLRDQILAEGLSVRATEARVRQQRRTPAPKPAHLVQVEEALQRHLGTPVTIRPGRRRGKIEITYRGEAELARLLARLQGAPARAPSY